MACPYFIPLRPHTDWTGPRRVPLGQPYHGACSLTNQAIDLRHCNLGYARHRCPHFPLDSLIDAVRFTIPSPGELIWITERNHAPVLHGTGIPEPFKALANAFLQSYETGRSPQGILK